MQRHHWFGLFALLTLVPTGATVGRLLGLSDGEGVYLTVFLTVLVGWWIGRRNRHQKEQL